MSSTDQAFIRAYGAAVQSPRTAAASVRAPAASAEIVDGILAEPVSAWLDARRLEVGLDQPVWTVHPSSIDVGLNSTVPAPHFVPRTATSVNSAATEFARPGAPPTDTAAEDRTASPHISFGRSPKAPLSAFAEAGFEAPDLSVLKPAFEVDAVRWPAVCRTLLAERGAHFSKLADDLRQQAAEGRKVIAISGLGRVEGRTTLALCLAKQLAETRIRVALVDADFGSPSIASRLNIDIQCGWETVLVGEQLIWDVMIEATADGLSIAPLGTVQFAEPMPRPVYGISAVLSELAERFDVVLVDAGPLTDGNAADWLLDPASGVQGIILAHDMRRNDARRLASACLQLAETGARQLGIAEMFVAEETRK